MQIKTLGRDWEVLVCGRQMKVQGIHVSSAHWVQSPRIAAFCGARIVETSQAYFPTDERTAIAAHDLVRGGIPATQVAHYLNERRETRRSRVTYFTETRSEMQDETTLARYFTRFGKQPIPFVQISMTTGNFANNGRSFTMKAASRMYFIFQLTVSVAVGLMGAASGRGLAVWLLGARSALASLSTKGIVGRDAMMSFLSFDGTIMQYETPANCRPVAGDLEYNPTHRRGRLSAIVLSILELGFLCAGWLYGALRVQRLRPQGVVGHGMLWLAVIVSLALSARSLFGLKRRISGRLIGIVQTHEYTRYVPGGSYIVRTKPIMDSTRPLQLLQLATTLLHDCDDDLSSIIAATGIVRIPAFGAMLGEHVAVDVIQYQYEEDAIVGIGQSKKRLNPADYYPWLQAAFCNVLTAACACMSAVYAYADLPAWIKPVTEVLLAISAIWYVSLAVGAGLPHDRDSYTCHLVATLVVSAVWYVGVEGVG